MLQKFIAFALLLVIISSCKEDEIVDYGSIDKKIIQDYIAKKGITGAKSTASGLYYIIQNPGSGSHPSIYSTVTVNYKGYLTDGFVFDSTKTGQPLIYPLNRLIAGWQQGIPLIGAMGKIQLFIPSALGYGASPQDKIPANSVLIFDIELIKFK